ncbi:hypothetical protein [Rhodoplanes serenus]|uniref:hypothetical protein n=1 Tax=Rhodoplanes serenus TaxID=200615 RepID=UPI000DAF3B99|nr:hypothetical protein [Rhodoplanes serenus]RAI31493.1 hypothetical protein CH340_18505 [Rhodoplanes serenus]
MKQLLAAAAALSALILGAWPALAAGSIPLSLSVQVDTQGRPLAGCLLYTYVAGTTTPQNAYQDGGLTIQHPWPVVCDAAGRLPQLFFADGSIKVRLTDRAGVQMLAADGVLVIGPSSGSGGGGAVDPTTVAATGDVKHKYGTGPISGWVRANGRTIGSATSGATERAHADAQALFEYLWSADSNLSVSGGRGASANADWLANKTIALPDARGRALAGLDDMGSTAAGRLTSSFFGATATVLGAAGGAESRSLSATNLPPISYTPAGTVSVSLAQTPHAHGVSDPGHNHSVNDPGHAHGVNNGTVVLHGGGGPYYGAGPNAGMTASDVSVQLATTGIWLSTAGTGVSIQGANANISVSSATFAGQAAALGGTSAPVRTVQPTILATIYIKL